MDGLQIQYCTCPDQIPLSQLQELLASAAFWVKERRPEKLYITTWKVMAIANSDPVVSVWDGEKMIGLARATSDCIYRAIFWDVVIHPDYQGVGLSQKLIETVLNHPRMNRVELVYLMTSNRQHFYEQIGFQRNSSTTMVLFNRVLANSSLSLTAEMS